MKIFKIHLDNDFCDDDGVQGGIEFDDGTFLVDIHYRDCCEHVYADWEQVANDSLALQYDFDRLKIQENKYGFRFGDGKHWVFVPCYNIQNGYYSSELEVGAGKVLCRVKRRGKMEKDLHYTVLAPTSVNVKDIDG